MKEVKIIISIFIIGIIATVIAFMVNHKNGSIKNDSNNKNNNYKYDINKQVKELNLKTIDDYIEYLNEMKLLVEPKALREMVIINKRLASIYIDSDAIKSENGYEIKNGLQASAYRNLIEIIIKKNQSWSKLPLTYNFKKKFNGKEGCIKEFDFTGKSIHSHNFKNKKFSVERSWIPDDAYEKYPAEQIEFMLEYGAGAYNLDYYNYEYILDEEGYLDDIVFLGITPYIVEGRFVDEGE